MRPQKVFVGQKYGMLTVVQELPIRNRGSRVFLCRCDCGGTNTPIAANLSNGNTTSCGCMKHRNPCKVTHGMSNTKPHMIYTAAKQRCNNPSNKNYARYGGRGIQFKFKSFGEFWNAMGDSYYEGGTLDRIDNNGHYEIGNVRWASRIEQGTNRSTTNKIMFNGITDSVSGWARRLGVSRKSMEERLQKWSIERALTEPTNKRS